MSPLKRSFNLGSAERAMLGGSTRTNGEFGFQNPKTANMPMIFTKFVPGTKPVKSPGQTRGRPKTNRTKKNYVYVPFSFRNSRRLWLFPGSVQEFWGKVPGRLRENCWKIFPNREMLQILRFRAPGKANLPETLGPRGVFWNRQFQPSQVFLILAWGLTKFCGQAFYMDIRTFLRMVSEYCSACVSHGGLSTK